MKIIGFLPVSRRAMELLKARNPKLVQRPIIVHGPTGNYTRNAWILPEEAASERPRAAQFDLFDQGPRETAAKPAEENAAHTAESGEYEKRDKAFRDALQEQAKRSNDSDVDILQQEMSVLKEGKLPDGDTLRSHGFPAPHVEYGGMDVSDISRALTILGYNDSSKKAIIKKMGRPTGTMSALRDAIVGYESEKTKKASDKKKSDESMDMARKMASENEDIAYAVGLYDSYDAELKRAKAERAEYIKMREYDSQRSMLGGLSRNNIRLQSARVRVAENEANKVRMAKEIDRLVKKHKNYARE